MIFFGQSRLPIRYQLAIGVAVVHAVMMTVFVGELVLRQRAELMENSLDQASGLAQTLASTSVSWVLASDHAGLQEVVHAISHFHDLRYAMVLSPDIRVLGDTDPARVGNYLSDPVSRSLAVGAAAPRTLIADAALIDTAEPILADGRLVGWARVSLSRDKLRAALIDVTWSGIEFTLLAIVLGTVFAFAIANRLTRRLDRVVAISSRVHQGDRIVRVGDVGEDEVGMLGRAFNAMLDSIERSELDLREAKNWAEAASRAKSDFLANMSHEIRTPMNAILGLAYLLGETKLTPAQRDYVCKTQVSATALLGIINDILDLSKVEAGRLALEHAPFRLDDIMRTLATIAAANTQDRDIEVLFQVTPGTPVALVGDALRLQQVLLNLIGNAIKFTSHGEVVLTIEPLAVTRDTARLAFSVRDTGVGIPPDHIGTIFDPFTQADASTTRRYGGTGLGLSICKRLVTLMDGEISVDSEPGRGSTFRFTATFGLGAAHSAAPALAPALRGPRRVLIADDNPVARDIMATMTRQFGWQVTVAASGRQAITLIDQSLAVEEPFDLILLDWVMPEIGGREVFAHIQRHHPPEVQPVILVVTAFEIDRIQREAGHDADVGVILTKPITPSVLMDAVAAAYAHTPPPAPPVSETGALNGYTLLLVEDNQINQEVARCILESVGACVETAASGAEALATLEVPGKRFDAVLMDIQMPGMDGYEACQRLRARPESAALPVIAMTADALPADRQRCLAAGMIDHIAKPLDVTQMIEIIRRNVGAPPQAPSGRDRI